MHKTGHPSSRLCVRSSVRVCAPVTGPPLTRRCSAKSPSLNLTTDLSGRSEGAAAWSRGPEPRLSEQASFSLKVQHRARPPPPRTTGSRSVCRVNEVTWTTRCAVTRFMHQNGESGPTGPMWTEASPAGLILFPGLSLGDHILRMARVSPTQQEQGSPAGCRVRVCVWGSGIRSQTDTHEAETDSIYSCVWAFRSAVHSRAPCTHMSVYRTLRTSNTPSEQDPKMFLNFRIAHGLKDSILDVPG